MRPPGDGDLTPFSEDSRVVVLILGLLANVIGKTKRAVEVLKFEGFGNDQGTITIDQLPAEDLSKQILYFWRSKCRGFLV